MRVRKPRKPSDAWQRWSASKLSAAMACPLRCHYEYILELPAPTNPAAAFGTAAHYLFYRFFKRHPKTKKFPYETKESFLGAWWLFWWTAVEGSGVSETALKTWTDWTERQKQKAKEEGEAEGEAEGKKKGKTFRKPKPHGFGMWSAPVQLVRWKDDADPLKYFRYGQKVLPIFFNVHDAVRRDGQRRWAEKPFTFSWGEGKFSGYIDRLDLEPDGAVIYDYKWGEYPEYLVVSGLQMTAYQRAYEEYLRPTLPGHPPLKAIRIYDYWTGTFQDVPIRKPKEIGLVSYYRAEAQAYYKGVLTGERPSPFLFTKFPHFRWEDMAEGTTTPRLPRAEHCTYCQHVRACVEYVEGNRPLARDAFRAKQAADEGAFHPEIIRLPFAETPIVRQAEAAYATLPKLYASLWQQPTLGFELPTAVAKPRRKKPGTASRKQRGRKACRRVRRIVPSAPDLLPI